ncbi:hypothetical protein B0O99DRAFT_621052 [Bisporella sp. PMI_857]|nr:hypothetical protein B0O99DRAFT_621052 [Bisporella sp. PMI_857]
MVVSRVVRASGCSSCRSYLLRTFASIPGPPSRLQSVARKSSRLVAILPQARFSSQLSQANPSVDNRQEYEELIESSSDEIESKKAHESKVSNESPEESASSLPWYLQVQTPQRAVQPLSERQKIPELPQLPPPILAPLLQQVSIDLGLDDLSLLDLRKLDPPPALGANLVMIIGTARSEKHLHVSADRLCRWLRSTYKLRPSADGLLGRNELKLKLRRKARRSKLLGSALDENEDDGVRTGWICVDIGVVDGPGVTESTFATQDFVGFGRRTDGIRLVVQMLTEEKREEMDLERLWTGILKRNLQALQPDPDSLVNSGEAVESIQSSNGVGHKGNASGTAKRGSMISNQTRGFHTSARQSAEGKKRQRNNEYTSPSGDYTARHLNLDELSTLLTLPEADKVVRLKAFLQPSISETDQFANLGWRAVVLQDLVYHLERMPRDYAIAALGSGFQDVSSTPFLTCFHASMSNFPSKFEGEARIWLHSYASEIGHKGYTPEGAMKMFHDLENFGTEISANSYARLLRAVLRPISISNSRDIVIARLQFKKNAIYIIQAMYEQGLNVLTEDILLQIQEGLANNHDAGIDFERTVVDEYAFDLPKVPMTTDQKQFHDLLMAVNLPWSSQDSRKRLLEIYLKQRNWLEFWDIWRMPSSRGLPQYPDMYEYMFNAVASTQHQKGCMAVLRTWVPEFYIEDYTSVPPEQAPLIKGSIVLAEQAIQSCLRIAEPNIERNAEKEDARGEWIDMWRKSTQNMAALRVEKGPNRW